MKTIIKKTKVKKSITVDTVKSLLVAISTAYPNDLTSPGIVLSYLKNGLVYGSIVRYHAKYGENKQIVFSKQSESLGEVLRGLSSELLNRQDIFDKLRNSI